MLDRGLSKKHEWCALKLNDYLGEPLRQSFARPQVERHIVPTPVVHREFRRHEGLGMGGRCHFVLRTIARHIVSVKATWSILSAHCICYDLLWRQRLDSMQNLCLFVAHSIRRKRHWRLHRCQSNQLQDVIGNHIAQSAGTFVISPAPFHAEILCSSNLDMVDVVSIPDRFEYAVAKTKNQEVLHRLFTKIVIDAIDLILA